MAIQEYNILKDTYFGSSNSFKDQDGNGFSPILKIGESQPISNRISFGINYRIFIQSVDLSSFLDLPDVQSLDQISKAELIFVTPPNPSFIPTVKLNNIISRPIASSWEEDGNSDTVTGGTISTYIPNNISDYFSPGNQIKIPLDLQTVKDRIQHDIVQDNGFLVSSSFAPVNSLAEFCSKDHPTPSYRPKLRITYQPLYTFQITKPADYKVKTTPRQTLEYEVPPRQDTFVGNLFDQSGNENDTTMRVGLSGGSDYRIFMQFSTDELRDFLDLQGVSGTDDIETAELVLTSASSDKRDPELYIHRLRTSWDDVSIRYNTSLSIGNPIYGVFDTDPFAEVGKVSRFDITELVKNWITGKWTNRGIRIIRGNAVNNSNGQFYASEHPDENLRPKIAITYTVANTLKDAQYNIKETHSQTKTAEYTLNALGAIQRHANYRIQTTPIDFIDFETGELIPNAPPLQPEVVQSLRQLEKDAQYSVATPRTIEKQASYSVLYRGDIDRSPEDYERLNKPQ